MSRPFPTTFDKDQSPIPMSSGSGGNTPISYKANVNRMKTKKWADAKPADYGGDDWGDDDEYDLPPPPLSKPTGLRQQGQGIQTGQPSVSSPSNVKKDYGELPPLPVATTTGGSRPRANSFDADDEKRNFSNSTVRQPSPSIQAAPGPATTFSQITGVPSTRLPSGPPALSITTQKLPQQDGNTGLRKSSQVVSPLSGSPHPDILLPGPGRTNTGDSGTEFSVPSRINTGESGSVYSQPSDTRTPSSDYQARRDFSPTAVPAPLSTTRASASPVPQSATDPPSSTRFPGRKSSLSQSTVPDLPQTNPHSQETMTHKSWVGGRAVSPGSTARSPSTPTGKALPFIRPADIYRRMEEEKEKERQSMDSNRPSMDSITGAKSSDRSVSPARLTLREKTSADSLGGGRQRTSFERDEASASARHLLPMLEPVKERKSEYGFEGFNMKEQAAEAMGTTEKSLTSSEPTQLDIEEARRSSVSPKLPDLNRMSGFGMDIFSQQTSEEPEPPLPQTSTSEFGPITSNTTPAVVEDTPERQPFLGHRSANHALDRTDDSSVTLTPTSQNVSGENADSESIGTTAVSPIMSKASTGGVPDIRGREGGNPPIKVIHEASSVATADERTATDSTKPVEHMIAPVIKPGNEQDIPTPSLGNSPATTSMSQKFPHSQEAVPANPSFPNMTDDFEALQPHRPIAEREGSFRPSLPGGWTSYATTATSENPRQDSAQVSKEVERTQTPTNRISSSHQHDDDDYDITPTTTKHSLPQSALGAAAGAAFGGATGAAFGRHDKDTPIASPVSEKPTGVKENSILTAPESAMAPSGNINPAATLDNRLMPKLESMSHESQFRPAPGQANTSTDSTEAPVPPAKDTPVLEDAEYFPKPTIPLKQRTMDEMEVDEALAPPMRSQALPNLSTDKRPQDEETDKLHKEIIKSLSPGPSDAAPTNESLPLEQLGDQAVSNEGRFSYLPREYDNYWATNVEDAAPASLATSTAQQIFEEPAQAGGPRAEAESPTTPTPPILPLSAWRTNTASESRSPVPTRFSWDTSGSDANLTQAQDDVPQLPGITPHQEPNQQRAANIPAEVLDEEIAPEPSDRQSEVPYTQPAALDYDKELGAQDLGSPFSKAPDKDHDETDTAIAGGTVLGAGAAAVAVAAVQSHSQPTPSSQHERRLSLAEEKEPRSSSYPVAPTPPEDDHPSRSPQPYFLGLSSDNPAATSVAPSSVSPVTSPTKTRFSPTSRILAFKEIAALKNTHQRIQTLDETRHRFANMESGLIDWISTLKAQHPEHANATGSFNGAAFPAPNGAAKSKVPGQSFPPLQQPYYQQYLNASPTTPGTPVSRSGPSLPSGSQQGFSPASSKLSSQQVQAKGKEFLHTAGVFGGKAGKAGKGLFAKGKNKLRGSGAGDKTSPNLSPPAKPKNERRSSWGFPLGAPRPSGQADASAPKSKESIPKPMPTPEHQRAATMDPQKSLPLDISTLANRDSPRLMSGAVGSPESQRPQSNNLTISHGFAHEAPENETEDQDRLGVPAQITKNQPSWDRTNSTPIDGEAGFQYQDRPEQQPQSVHAAAQSMALAIPDETDSKSERSNSGDAHFYDAHEEPSDLNDWVLVSPEPKATKFQPKSELEQSKSEPEIYQPPEGPPPRFLERQQTAPLAEPGMTSASEQLPVSVQHQSQTQPNAESQSEYEVYQTPDVPLSFSKRQQGQTASESEMAKFPKPPGIVSSHSQPEPESRDEVSKAPDEPPSSVLNRPRFSYEAPLRSQTPTFEPQVKSFDAPDQQNFVHSAGGGQYQQPETKDPSRNASFKGLPPIRRTSTFGLGFGTRKGKQRLPIDGEEGLSTFQSQPDAGSQNYETEIGAAAGAAAVAAHANHSVNQGHHTMASTNFVQQRKASKELYGASRPEVNQTESPDYIQRTSKPHTDSQTGVQAPRTTDVPVDDLRRSQDAWRPNAVSRPIQASHNRDSSTAVTSLMEQQRSLDSQHSMGLSDASQIAQRPDVQYGPPIVNQPVRPALYDQPPSSAQRYPELFQAQQQGPAFDLARDGELPAHMYQAPVPREATFLPRQQTNEYQLPGVGPPVEDPRHERLRRNSGSFFKDLGGRISRGTSRERGNSISRDGGISSQGRPLDSRGYEYPESSVTSEEGQEQQKRRSSFFGNLNRASTTGLGPPQSRESVVAHFPGSRTDLLGTPQPSSPIGERKRSLFGTASSGSPKQKANKLSRSSTSGMSDEPGKKRRFSGLSSMFSRTGNPSSRASLQDRPQALRQLSNTERQPIESPQFDQQQSLSPPPPTQNSRGQSQQRQFLPKLSIGGDPKNRDESKTRRPSASNLLSGIMGRKSDQKDRAKEDSSSQGTRSQGSQPQYHPKQVPLGQTYTDLQEESQLASPPRLMHQSQSMRYQERPPQPQQQERGRRTIREPAPEFPREPPREPQYDTVPIPGGYQLVRGDGALTVPTDYDPRGLARFQQDQQVDPRYMLQQQPRRVYTQGQPPLQGGPQRPSYDQQPPHYPQPDRRISQGKRPPALSAVETYENYTKHSSPRLSREELLARSPAREQPGQQRPYQLSLPEDEEDRDHRPHRLSKSPPIISPPSSTRSLNPGAVQPPMKQHDAIQRLQQPLLRHPESPAGYPLPDDAISSPVNEAARDIPPPPPPKWPSNLDAQRGHNPHQLMPQNMILVESELDRSNTRRTAVSAVSGMSGLQSSGLHPPRKEDEAGREITPSPTPPSPAYTPEREQSPPRYSVDEKELERGLSGAEHEREEQRGRMLGDEERIRTTHVNRGPSPDLYNASPRLPPTNSGFASSTNANSSHWNGNLSNRNGNGHTSSSIQHDQQMMAQEGQGSGARSENGNGYMAKRRAEIENQKKKAQEEKIYYNAETGEEGHHEDVEGEPVMMSATSYPGQEWNPYLAGGYEDFD